MKYVKNFSRGKAMDFYSGNPGSISIHTTLVSEALIKRSMLYETN